MCKLQGISDFLALQINMPARVFLSRQTLNRDREAKFAPASLVLMRKMLSVQSWYDVRFCIGYPPAPEAFSPPLSTV